MPQNCLDAALPKFGNKAANWHLKNNSTSYQQRSLFHIWQTSCDAKIVQNRRSIIVEKIKLVIEIEHWPEMS